MPLHNLHDQLYPSRQLHHVAITQDCLVSNEAVNPPVTVTTQLLTRSDRVIDVVRLQSNGKEVCKLSASSTSKRRAKGVKTVLTVEIDPILTCLCTEAAGVKLALTKQVAARPGFTNQYNQQN
jgi:hypothetical protein